MHVNPVAFAVAALRFADPHVATKVDLTRLINFGFATSGISCADKIKKFNLEQVPLVADVEAASRYYNLVASDAGSRCNYFPGICDLIASLKLSGALHFITSAVEQTALDAWAESQQGALLSHYITEILGQRPGFDKGKDHFAYAREQYGVEKIIYIADATPEIIAGAKYSEAFNITPVGFAHEIDAQKVREAYDLVLNFDQKQFISESDDDSFGERNPLVEADLSLPGQAALTTALKNAGAAHTVGGNCDQIVGNLRDCFEKSLLNK